MVAISKESFFFSAIGKFVGRLPSLEGLEQWVQTSWSLSRHCLVSLTERCFFLFRFNTKEDRDCLVSQSPLLMERKKLLLQPWSPGQDVSSWLAVTPVWIRLKGIPYHCWSSDILLSIAGHISKPLRLDEITASQKMLSFARVLVHLDMAKPNLTSVMATFPQNAHSPQKSPIIQTPTTAVQLPAKEVAAQLLVAEDAVQLPAVEVAVQLPNAAVVVELPTAKPAVDIVERLVAEIDIGDLLPLVPPASVPHPFLKSPPLPQ
ncbi:hypothetical protein AAC387_Pa02g0315 [Persea americana]